VSESGPVLLLSTVPTREDGDRIAQALVAERLAACVNVVPGLVSTYRWKGAVERADELLLLVKTRAEMVEDLGARLRALHPYDVPEMVVLPIVGGLETYLAWITDSLR
jgi:periplasmic divalent cation tolerance protein